MPVALIGSGGAAADVDGSTFRANKVSRRPGGFECYGQYQVAAVTGIITAGFAASAQFFQFQWGDYDSAALITYISVSMQPETAFTANTLTDLGFDVRRYRNIAGQPVTGTDLTPSAGVNNCKTRTSMGVSRAAVIQIATTSALTAVTGSLDSNAIANSQGLYQRVNPTTGTTEEQVGHLPFLEFAPSEGNGDMPVVLHGNQAIVIRNRVVWPAAGTAILCVNIRWSEFEKTRY